MLLCTRGETARIIFAMLEGLHLDVRVVAEAPRSRMRMLTRRVARIGLGRALGQLLFIAFVQPVLRRSARARISEIVLASNLLREPIPDRQMVGVASVNSEETRAILRETSPDLVVLAGTRIVSPETLAAVDCPFLNLHMGITPRYRGVHGGYWALFENRPDLVGTTIHRVDEGIDTGDVVRQVVFPVEKSDSFASYPILHLVAARDAFCEVVREYIESGVMPSAEPLTRTSELRYHPTLVQYLFARLRRGVR